MTHPNLKKLAEYETIYNGPMNMFEEKQIIEAHKIISTGSIIFFSNNQKLELSFNSLKQFNKDFQDCIDDNSFEFERIAYTKEHQENLYKLINKNYGE